MSGFTFKLDGLKFQTTDEFWAKYKEAMFSEEKRANDWIQYRKTLSEYLTPNVKPPQELSFDYSEELIDQNEKYFKNCMGHLSAYKALLFCRII